VTVHVHPAAELHKPAYRAIADHRPDATVGIPPRLAAVPNTTAHKGRCKGSLKGYVIDRMRLATSQPLPRDAPRAIPGVGIVAMAHREMSPTGNIVAGTGV
jgi:hypothetical protein